MRAEGRASRRVRTGWWLDRLALSKGNKNIHLNSAPPRGRFNGRERPLEEREEPPRVALSQ